jgi:hypothetical protein
MEHRQSSQSAGTHVTVGSGGLVCWELIPPADSLAGGTTHLSAKPGACGWASEEGNKCLGRRDCTSVRIIRGRASLSHATWQAVHVDAVRAVDGTSPLFMSLYRYRIRIFLFWKCNVILLFRRKLWDSGRGFVLRKTQKLVHRFHYGEKVYVNPRKVTLVLQCSCRLK